MSRVAKLIFVSDKNNNKYYDMLEEGSNLYVTYGRVGVTEQKKTYPASRWDSIYKSKVKKGYTDVTELRCEVATVDFQGISDNTISSFVNELQGYAKGSVAKNYTIASEAVTQQQVDEAQKLLDKLSKLSSKIRIDKVEFNKLLIDLYQVIPRRMKKVQNHLLGSDKAEWKKRAKEIVEEEQNTLDVMAGQVKVNTVQKTQKKNDKKTILDAMGLEILPVSEEDVKIIKRELGGIKNQYVRAFKVVNKRTQSRFDNFVEKAKNKKTKLFWHGSRNENWWSIIDSGLVLRPSNAVKTGSMFGKGLYAADRARKSLGYTSLQGSYWARGSSRKGFMALYDVHLGNQLVVSRHEGWMSSLDHKKLQKKGNYDSLFAKKGQSLYNNEYVVYREEQMNIRFIVEIR